MRDKLQILKDVASTLAEAAISEKGYCVLRLLKQLIQVSGSTPLPLQSLGSSHVVLDRPHRIGIWQPKLRNGDYSFVKIDDPNEPSSLWANVRIIEPKGNRKRVVLIGESVARGFFFDPHFNPAMVLQKILRETSGNRDLEVVDLARTDLMMEPLQQLVAAAIDLKPDAIIVLAGNNWQPMLHLDPANFLEISLLLNDGKWADVKQYLESILHDRVRQTLHNICKVASDHKLPLIIALPEFNLMDWRTEAKVPPLLTTSTILEWCSVQAEAGRLLVQGAFQHAEVLGARLLALDGGTTAAGPNVLANAKLKVGNVAAARKYFEMARDSAICWSFGTESPRCYSTIQEVVRNEAMKNQFTLVDIPRAFQDHWPSGLPDRRMFLDYCHFTIEGTHAAMSAVAQAVLMSLFKIRRPIRDLNRVQVEVEQRVRAEAHFLAAVHNANWGQPTDVIRYHCMKAVEFSASVDRLMTLYLDFHIRRMPSALCKSFDEMCQIGSTSAISLLFDSARPVADNFLNVRLIQEIVEALKQRAPSLKNKVQALLSSEHAVDYKEVDLLTKAYSVQSHRIPLAMSRYAFYRVYDRTSVFLLIIDHTNSVRLTANYRTPYSVESQLVTVCIKGQCVGSFPTSLVWISTSLVIPSNALSIGINHLEISWPVPELNLQAWKSKVSNRFQEGLEVPDVNPCFGEIHSLKASIVAKKTEEINSTSQLQSCAEGLSN